MATFITTIATQYDVESIPLGLRAQFAQSKFVTDDEDMIAWLESLPEFGSQLFREDGASSDVTEAVAEVNAPLKVVAGSVTSDDAATNNVPTSGVKGVAAQKAKARPTAKDVADA